MLAQLNGAELRRLDETQWQIPRQGRMRVPARVFAGEELLDAS